MGFQQDDYFYKAVKSERCSTCLSCVYYLALYGIRPCRTMFCEKSFVSEKTSMCTRLGRCGKLQYKNTICFGSTGFYMLVFVLLACKKANLVHLTQTTEQYRDTDLKCAILTCKIRVRVADIVLCCICLL